MGVDFFPCYACGEAICDCGTWLECSCGRKWCDLTCAAKDGSEDWEGADKPNCKFCRKEDATDEDLLAFLLKRFFLTRARAVKMLRKHNG